jgi:hypothetical protein
MLRREIQISQAPLANDPSTDTPRVPRCFRSEERLSARCAELCRPSIRLGEVARTRPQAGREGRPQEGEHETSRPESGCRSLRLAGTASRAKSGPTHPQKAPASRPFSRKGPPRDGARGRFDDGMRRVPRSGCRLPPVARTRLLRPHRKSFLRSLPSLSPVVFGRWSPVRSARFLCIALDAKLRLSLSRPQTHVVEHR